MRVISLKLSIPKVAVLATGLAGAVLVATINPAPVAQAYPNRAANCAGCHTVGGSTTAAPSTLTPAAGASYTVAITLANNPAGGNSGYAIIPVTAGTGTTNGGNTGADLSYTATMTAPAASGTYVYNVYTNMGSQSAGSASSAKYTITVAPVVTVPPTTVAPTTVAPTTVAPTTVAPTTVAPTTVAPTTVAPTTVAPTTVAPTTVAPTTVAPTTVAPTTVAPTTVAPTTVAPTTVAPTTVMPTTVAPTTVPPASTMSVRSLSPDHGKVGTKVTIRGTGFGKAGVVNFGAGEARVSSWSSTKIVVKVPSTYIIKVESKISSTQPVWYRHDDRSVMVTVTPTGVAASNAIAFSVDSRRDDHHGDDGHRKARHDR